MPSDDRLRLALDAVTVHMTAYRVAVNAAAERVRAMLAVGGGIERARIELGALGAARIDVARFAELSHGVALDASNRELIGQAASVLSAFTSVPESAFVVSVPVDERASACITSALANFGRAFAAARVADLVRAGRYDPVDRDEYAVAYGPDRWSSAERMAAPPIVAIVNGADLHAAELGELLDGTQHIVLVVEGACPPAALVRLITPSTFVLQTTESRGLDRFRDYRGPAIAAFVDDHATCFAHDPTRGAALWQRLEIWQQPAPVARKRIGGASARQQAEEVAQLVAMATQPAFSASKLGDLVPAGADAVDRLTDWLLTESGLARGNR
jgi:hypothetical protein